MNTNDNDLHKNHVEINLNATLTLTQSPSKCCRCSTQGPHPENSLRLAGEILIKLAAGQYTPSETPGAWEVIKTLLNSYFQGNPS